MGRVTNENVVSFRTKENEVYTHVHFRCGIITPSILKRIEPPMVDYKKGVMISGRGPVWLYAAITHYYHPAKFVMVYEPRADSGIVVQSHSTEYSVGDIIPREKYE